MASFSKFRGSLSGDTPPSGLNPSLCALWWAAKGAWDDAHKLVQGEESSDAAWVHAYLHRVEGDLSNAAYWYRRAGQEQSTGAVDQEWAEIVAVLLDKDA